ncbi:adenylosuccinate lyase [bacterium endosymbiont of Pedicinus badii]|uniref:adenylosuccinate lyase n=1 Tax=bacterium endosymbiont of Pedicinus badii TaxID=1719126 RepID=UPI0009BBB960|nr:adenylosuccinate lyase [bacterium endosymbiont of Pedicinus badii]OQM34376.1 adenylosuccinate lyase [bacterium endosymbiont of Pedicinus badii]
MKLSELTAISPIDGRYGKNLFFLRSMFSEYGLIKNRIFIEIEWFKKLSFYKRIKEIPKFTKKEVNFLDNIYRFFNLQDAKKIKEIEKKTNHDVKSIEYFIKEKISKNFRISLYKEFIHFACTSEDINNLSYAIILLKTKKFFILPIWKKIISVINIFAFFNKNTVILGRTHGEVAIPTTLCKEIINFSYRLLRQYKQLKKTKILGKINGAIGSFNAHTFAYPKIDWEKFSKKFVEDLGISWNPYTTQIEPHDYIAEYLSCIVRFNNILIQINRDIWRYNAIGYFKKNSNKQEIGSSTMPHKINPIEFENSEGNLEISNAIMNCIINNATVSRWQRDLKDSTILRNLGVSIAHSIQSYRIFLHGFKKLRINQKNITKDIEKNWKILLEPIQTIMRKNKISDSYEKIKNIFHENKIDKNKIREIIKNIPVTEKEKNRLYSLRPEKYIGISKKILKNFFYYFKK